MSKKKKIDVLVRLKQGNGGTDLAMYIPSGDPKEKKEPVPLDEAVKIAEYIYNSLIAIQQKGIDEIAGNVVEKIMKEDTDGKIIEGDFNKVED